jgi:[ribosomal protein S5]-alanine N-acetyltransferase
MDSGALETAWPSSFPELATERLRLRAPLPRDAAALLSILGDSEVTRYHNMPTLTTLAEAHAALERLQQRYTARDAIRWAIELVEHGDMIGTAGLLRIDFEHRRAEVGYEIARRWWGRGLTPEAVAAVISYGFFVLGLHRIEAGVVLPGNDASVRVLQKLGFLEQGPRRDYLYCKGRFQTFRWFSLLETDESPRTHPMTAPPAKPG